MLESEVVQADPLEGALAKWQHTSSLTEAERDEVDFQVQLIIKKCLDRVQELEHGENCAYDLWLMSQCDTKPSKRH